jgi:hypothetical protein
VAPLFAQRVERAGDGLAGYLVGGDASPAFREHAATAGFDPVRCLVSRLLALQLQVRLLPFLVVIDPEGRLLTRELIQSARSLDRTLAAVPAAVTA